MAGAGAEDRSHGSDTFPFKLPSFIPNLFPFLKPKPVASTIEATAPPKPVDRDSQKSTYETVTFPINPSNKNIEPLKFEAEASSGRTSNSFVLWQVYALGGFLVLKWAWARWNERNESIDKNNDDQPSHEDDGGDDEPSRGHED